MPLNIPVWRRRRDITLPITPVSSAQDLGAIFEDLKADREVMVNSVGNLVHSSSCDVNHKSANVPWNLRIGHQFVLHIEYTSHQGAPKVWLTRTSWTPAIRAKHPHRWNDGSACLVAHSDPEWATGTRSVVDYVEQACIWAAKSEFWIAKGAKRRGVGWLGRQLSHKPKDLLKLSDGDRCPCGNWASFATCCKPKAVGEGSPQPNVQTALSRSSIALGNLLLRQYDQEWIYGSHHMNLSAPCPRRGVPNGF